MITTLLDHDRYSDGALALSRAREKIESAYLAPWHTALEGHVLRSGDQAGLEQESWALLTLHQLMRRARRPLI